GSWITAQAHLGVKLASNVAGLRKLDCGHLTKNEAARSAADLVLKNPRPCSTGAHSNAEAWDIIVENYAVGHTALKLYVAEGCCCEPHYFSFLGTFWEAAEVASLTVCC